MSHKGKHRKTPASKPVAAQITGAAELPARAAAALSAGRYREAAELYKELLKREQRPEWRDALASAYAGRAADLADKGMLKEALALWRTRAELCGTPLGAGPYVDWLVRAGQAADAFGLLADPKLPATERTQLEMRLAAAALVAADGTLARLPADSALVAHRAAARAALAALGRGDPAQMATQLQAIPFRSPYRDLRPILKALGLAATPGTDSAQAAEALARLPADGPFAALSTVARAAFLPGEQWLAALRELDADAQQLLLDIKGCARERRPLLLDFASLGAAPAAPALFDVLLRHRRHLAAAASLCRRLLPHVPERLKIYQTSFGPLPAGEPERVLAVAAELRGRFEEAERHWLGFACALDATRANNERVAMVLRHLAAARHHRDTAGVLDDQALEWLANSIELDPEDCDSHLMLIHAWRERDDLKRARSHLEAALARFPKDAEVLLEAVETALAGGAFKKAAGLAKQVLELDPINPRVRGIVGQAHLSHARKHIKARNAAAARKELDEAAEWLRTASERGSLKLLRGLVEAPAKQGDVLLREAVAELGGMLVGGFHLAIEAKRVAEDAKALLRRAAIDLKATPAAEEVVALAHALNTARDGDKTLRAALDPLREMLGRAARQDFPEPEHLMVCEALHRRDELKLTRSFAEAALKRWPRRPVFVYLRAAAAYQATPWAIPNHEFHALEDALEEAHRHGDQRTVLRIEKLLAPPFGSPDDEFGDPGDVDLDDPNLPLDLLLALGGVDHFLDMLRQQLGNAVFQKLQREIGGTKQEFAQRLVEMLANLGPPPGIAAGDDFGPPAKPPASPAPRRSRQRPPPDVQAPDNQKDLFDD